METLADSHREGENGLWKVPPWEPRPFHNASDGD